MPRTISIVIGAGARDTGNSPTTLLRRNLVLGRNDANGFYYPYRGDQSGGRQIPSGLLYRATDLSQDVDTPALLWVGGHGPFDPSDCPGLDPFARSILERRGLEFCTSSVRNVRAPGMLYTPLGIARYVANHTVLTSENGYLLQASAAVTFTLPEKENGLAFRFLQMANADLTIATGNSNDIIARGMNGASSVAYSTTNQRIGSHCLLECLYTDVDTLNWIFTSLCNHTLTVG